MSNAEIRTTAWCALCALLIAACGGGETPEDGMDPSVTAGSSGDPAAGAGGGGSNSAELAYAPCDDAERVGRFEVALAARFTGVNGQVLDGIVPADVPEEVASSGACRLLRPRALSCTPPCGGDETCAEDGTCVPYPRRQNVGTVTLTGLKTSPVVMMPLVPGNTYTNPGSLPHPGFDEGAEIALEADGGDHAPFALRGVGVAQLQAPADPILVERGSPARITWTPPGRALPTGVHVVLDIARHGGTPARIECEAEDTGSFEVPAELVTQLVDLGFSGFPAVNLTRRSADSVQTALGCVELVVTSEARLAVEVPGLMSCNGDPDCPDGQRCSMELRCE